MKLFRIIDISNILNNIFYTVSMISLPSVHLVILIRITFFSQLKRPLRPRAQFRKERIAQRHFSISLIPFEMGPS